MIPAACPAFIPLRLTDAPLTVDQLRAVLGPQIDKAVLRIVERVMVARLEKAS